MNRILLFCTIIYALSINQITQTTTSVSYYKPTVIIKWTHEETVHYLSHECLHKWPLFELFDKDFFEHHQLPLGILTYRNDSTQSVDTAILIPLLEELIAEVQQRKKKFTHFIVLHKITFNRKLRAGCLVVKFKDYPFVVKLFMENPHSFVRPFEKGWEPYLHFFMGGGISRHLCGFTRIKNLHHINQCLALSNYWSSIVSTPRKWFWTPENTPQLELTGINCGSPTPIIITIPGIYCIIADAIESERMLSICNARDRTLVLSLSNYLDLSIDPNTDNFMIEQGTHKIVIVDTEHFPTLLGLTARPKPINNYGAYYWYLIIKAIGDLVCPRINPLSRPFDVKLL